MWRFVALAALGIVIGTKARSERQVLVIALLFGLFYGAAEAITLATVAGPVAPGRTLLLLLLGIVMAAPVYATAEIWRRLRSRARVWLARLLKR
jgi:hypothetical protein